VPVGAVPAVECWSVIRHRAAPMRFERIEFSWRAAFIGLYMTPERDKVWITILPFFPLYFKRGEPRAGAG